VSEVDVVPRAWRGIDELAGLIGAYCWVENRIFELSGAWATGASGSAGGGLPPALRVWCAGLSRRHGLLAAGWADRLPVRAGVDRAALVCAPPGPLAGAFQALAATSDAGVGAVAMIEVVLPRLQAVYEVHRQTATPVSEGSVLEVLAAAHRDLAAEIGGGRTLMERWDNGLTRDAALSPEVERAFAETHVFPAVPAS
jgi:hypothetical protein